MRRIMLLLSSAYFMAMFAWSWTAQAEQGKASGVPDRFIVVSLTDGNALKLDKSTGQSWITSSCSIQTDYSDGSGGKLMRQGQLCWEPMINKNWNK